MAQLAIRGHATRGKEVIEILEMLGGINKYNLRGNTDEWFVLNGTQIQRSDSLFAERGFTLEEFLEKFPYKVGDKVTLDKLTCTIKAMSWDCDDVIYYVQGVDLLKGVYSKDKTLQPYKEENMDEREEKAVNHVFDVEVISFDIAQKDKYELDLQGKFEVVLREGKYYVERIKPKYPNTYEECCKILQVTHTEWHGYLGEVLVPFQKLLICRDAYWKIAGDWEPNWEDETDIYYTISYDGVNIKCYNNTDVYSKFAFPTEEMRDAFYENFKYLIEQCKEFL